LFSFGDDMRKFVLVLLLLCVSCFRPSVNTAPRLRSSVFVASGTSEFRIEGQGLFATAVQVAGQSTQILEIDPNGQYVRIQLNTPLPSGTYSLQVTTATQTLNAPNGITVLEVSDVFSESDFGSLATRNQYILGSGGLLAFKPGANRAAVTSAINAANFSVLQTQEPLVPGSSSVCGQTMVLLSDNITNRSVLDGLNALQQSLESLEAGVVFDLNAKYVADEPSADTHNATLDTAAESRSIPATPLNLPADLSKARVAVIDSGVNVNHSLFTIQGGLNVLDIAAARNFTAEGNSTDVSDLATERTADGLPITSSNLGHGTAVAGIVASTIQESINPALTIFTNTQLNKHIVPIKACEGSAGRCKNSSVVLAVCYAISLNQGTTPVKVINLSLGSKYPSSLLLSALNDAAQRGMTLVSSAGNKGMVSSKPPNFPANYSIASSGSFDAVAGLISVGSVELVPSTTTYQASGFSSQAPSVTVSANGVVNMIVANNTSSSQMNWRVFSGTSFSAPVVSAAASLYYAKYAGAAGINPVAFKQKLVSTALLSGTATFQACPASKCGAGLLNITGILTP
jgi:hypothetical protein